MSPHGTTDQTGRESLRTLCAALVRRPDSDPLASQVERLALRFGDGPYETSQAIARAFRARGLIPERLVATLAARDPDAAPALAVRFAACAYPERAYRMGESQLESRVEAFETAV